MVRMRRHRPTLSPGRGTLPAGALCRRTGRIAMPMEGLEPLPSGVLDTLRRASTASITSELFKLGIRHSFMTGVEPLDPEYRMVGEAVTLRYLPYREDLNAAQSVADPEHPQRKTIDNIQAGGILVIDRS